MISCGQNWRLTGWLVGIWEVDILMVAYILMAVHSIMI